MGFTPQEAARIPFGCMEAIVSSERTRIREQIRKTKERLNLLYVQSYLLQRMEKESWDLKTKYAKGELP